MDRSNEPPRDGPRDAPGDLAGNVAGGPAGEAAGTARGSVARILHADDSEANRYAVSRSLRRAGFEVVEADCGRGALDAMASRPDLVILDVRLPDMSGFEVCRLIKADPEARSVPVLHLTASLVDTRHKVQGLEGGADAYLVRPVEPVELIATVKALLRIRRGEEALRALNQSLERRVTERTAELLAYQQRLRGLVGELGRAEQRERQRLAAELHDNLVQLLVACKIRVSALQASAAPRSKAARGAGEIKNFLDEGIGYARTLMADLAPVLLNDQDLGAAVESVAKRMGRHGLRVRVADDGLPKPLNPDVLGLLFQSVRELLFNVVKHAGTDAAEVTLERSGGEVRVTVCDGGAGFDPAARRAGPSVDGGFGLLSIVERLALLGGRVEIDSAPGRGARVALVAPVAAPPAPPVGSEPPGVDAPEAAGRGAAGRGPAVRVVLADDHRVIREGLKSIIDDQPDLRVVGEASDGVEALERVRALRPDVVVMDVHMPGLNGLEATRRIKSEWPAVTVVGLSVGEDEEMAAAMREAGAAAHLGKGGEVEPLLDAIRARASR